MPGICNKIPGDVMPVFLEGKDPLGPSPALSMPFVKEPPPPNYDRPPPAIDAAFRQYGPFSVLANWKPSIGDYDPDHNPFEMIKGTPFENDPDQFVGSRNAAETKAIMEIVARRQTDLSTLAQAGRQGTGAIFFAEAMYALPIAIVAIAMWRHRRNAHHKLRKSD